MTFEDAIEREKPFTLNGKEFRSLFSPFNSPRLFGVIEDNCLIHVEESSDKEELLQFRHGPDCPVCDKPN